MGSYAVKEVDAMETAFRGAFKRARAELGVESFGMQIIDLPAEFEHYPEHDHLHDGQEEVFVAMRGSAEIELDGERHPLDDNHVVRAAPTVRRKLWPGPEGLRVLVLGGVPGAVYDPPDVSKLGEPDPMAKA